MPYSASKDPFPSGQPSREGFATTMRAVTPSDDTDLSPYAKAIQVTAPGDIVILPMKNADGATITYTGCSVGFIPACAVRRVLATGTSASVATLDD